MNKVTKLICLVLVVIVGLAGNEAVAAERGEKTFGVRTGYVSRNKSVDAGLFFQYTFSEHFRLEPSADIVFRHDDRDAFMVDLNAQVPFSFSKPSFDLYPFAGLNFSSWNRHYPDEVSDFNDDVSTRTNRFGVNVGAGFDLKVADTMKLSLQAGYTFVKANSAFRLLVGIGYIF